MNTQTSTRRVTFNHAFLVPGMTEAQGPGSFDLVIEQIPLDLSWEAYRTSCTLIVVRGGTTSAYPVAMADVEAALLADQQHDVGAGFS